MFQFLLKNFLRDHWGSDFLDSLWKKITETIIKQACRNKYAFQIV